MQRPAPLAAPDLRFGSPRFRYRRIAHHSDERVQCRIQPFDAIQAPAGNLHG